MTVPAPYLEGLLAAARPGDRKAAVPSPVETPPASAETTNLPAAISENVSSEERIKRDLHPLDSFPRVLACGSANWPPDPDDRFRFQWFGLFYQAPEQDAFTLRLRLPGGRIKPFQLAGLSAITQRHASGQVLLNFQGGLDIPGLPIKSVAEVLEQVEGIGFSSLHTGGDCVQAIRGGELDGSPADGTDGCPPIYPLVRALEQVLARGPAFSDLPLPCEIVFQTADEPRVVPPRTSIETIILQIPTKACVSGEETSTSITDSSFLLHLPGEAKEGLSLPLSQVVSGCVELLKAWAAGADRSSREAASLAAFLSGLDSDTVCALLGGAERASLPSASELKSSLVESRSAPGLAVPDNRLLSGQLTALEQRCREHGWQELRLRRNHLYVVGANGKILDAKAIMQSALSA